MTRQADEGAQDKIVVQGDLDLQDLIPGFLENRRRDVGTLTAAVERGDFPAIQSLGHRMKGDGGGYGFEGLSAIGIRLEQAAKDRNVQAIRDGVADLSSYLRRVEVVYEAP